MKKNLRLLCVAAVGSLVSLALTSCYYDPNYGSTSVGASYSSGYGQGYGYGGSNFSTSVFVSTGNPQWGYDPNCYSYYDYNRRAYYDPYLNGYYPVGYRPPIVYGVPHPYGWHRGGGYIRPPVRVSNVTINNYQNRAERYKGTSYGWAKQVRQQPASQGRVVNSHPPTRSGGQNNGYNRSNSSNSSNARSQATSNNRGKQATGNSSRTSTNAKGRQQSGTLPSRYNTPVRASEAQGRQGSGTRNSSRQQAQSGQPSRQQAQRGQANRQQSQRAASNQQPQSRNANGKGKNRDNDDKASRYR